MPTPSADTWSGIFPIPVTPFDEAGTLVLDDLRRQVAFSVGADDTPPVEDLLDHSSTGMGGPPVVAYLTHA